jgi:hypothetical protein
MKSCPKCGHPNDDQARACGGCGGEFSAVSPQTKSNPSRPSLLQDSSKAVGLLFGTLVILTLFGIAVAIRMLWTTRPAGLVEILLFGLLAADAAILLMAVRRRTGPGLIGYLGVWVLGLIPYFGWVIVYGAGHGIAEVIERRRANAALIALLVWIGVVILCLGVHLFVGSAPPPL